MTRERASEASESARGGSFATTHWSVVLTARGGSSGAELAALERLCSTYWYPLFGYLRREGHRTEDAQDLTQEFFHRLLQRRFLAQVDPHKGTFRSFLLAALKHFLANEWDREHAVKRGGRFSFVPFDEENAEQRYAADAAMSLSPEQLYERSWAIALLEKVLARLRGEMAAAGRLPQFEAAKVFLVGAKHPVPYVERAARLGTTEAALKMVVQRLRHRYGELLRDEIGQTVNDPREIQDELRHLLDVLS